MGYYTTFKLNAAEFKDRDQAEFFEFKLVKETEYTGWDTQSYPVGEKGYEVSATLSEVKWYDHEEDLLRLSTQFPGVLIELEGVGEEPGDQWRMRVRDGKAARVTAQIVFPDFDDSV